MPRSFASVESKTMADVIDMVQRDDSLKPVKKRKIEADIRTACSWFGMSPGDVIAHPMDIRPRFAALSPGKLDVSKKRIQNVRSTVKCALRRVDIINGRSFKVPLTPVWQKLVDTIADRYLQKKVRCIATLASAMALMPSEVDDSFSEVLLEAIKSDRLSSDPRFVHQNAVRAWNKLAVANEMWPKIQLTSPRYRRLPEQPRPVNTLAAEIESFLIRHSTDDPYDLSVPDNPWDPSTVATYRRYLQRTHGLLTCLGYDSSEICHLRDLVVPLNRTISALKLMQQQNGGEGRIGASHIARLLGQVARSEAMKEQGSTEARLALEISATKLVQIADRLHKRTKTLSKKVRARILPFRDEKNLGRLFLLPFGLMRRLSRKKLWNAQDLLVAQLAFALLILTFCPLRIGSLLSIRLDKHLIWSRPAMSGDLTLCFEEGELKGDAPEVLPLPPECAKALRAYLSKRKQMNMSETPFLFPGRPLEKPKNRSVMSSQLSRLIFDESGYSVHPHLYRHLVHLLVLSRFPGAYAMISRVLTHRSLETARKNYAYFDVALSMRAYQGLVRAAQSAGAEKSEVMAEVAYGIQRESTRDGTP